MDDMMNDEIVLCAASAYEEKFYLNPEFDQCILRVNRPSFTDK